MNEIIKVGLVGYGKGGEYFHAPIINSVPGLKLTDVVERNNRSRRKNTPG